MLFSFYPAPPPGIVDEKALTVFPDDPCPYLPGRLARVRGFLADRYHPLQYHRLMDRGFRRAATLFYQPVCLACRECVPLRVPVDKFLPTRSQRRVWKRNAGLRVQTVALSELRTGERQQMTELFVRYQREWHGSEAMTDLTEPCLFQSPVNTVVTLYRAEERLLAAGICDVCERSVSSVYFYFDPSERSRSLGTYGALWEIAWARRLGVPYYYLGYRVRGCAAMEYKARFTPHELLGADARWRPPVP